MKYKIPTDVFVHPDSGEPCRYDPDTGTVDSAHSKVIPFRRLQARSRRSPMAGLKTWLRSFLKGENGG